MADTIFVMDAQGTLIPMVPSDYDAEDVLQQLLSAHPELLPLSAGESPARWLLVTREAAIPDDNGGDRFYLDHLLLDAEGVPTLVEVKRSTDSRIRREVVGQMLDYASHFVIHWTVERVRSTYEATCATLGKDPADPLAALIGDLADADAFWQRVKTNLLARRIRLLFVADRIPPELRRVVEFLNAVTDPVEVLAVEVPQYTGRGLATFVPRVIGQTVASTEKKTGATSEARQWDEPRFLRALAEKVPPEQVECARRILAWAKERMLRISWGTGKQLGSLSPVVDHKGTRHWCFSLWTDSSVQIALREMKSREPFKEEARRLELIERLNAGAGLAIPANAVAILPTFKLAALTQPQHLEGFLKVWDWYLEEVRKS